MMLLRLLKAQKRSLRSCVFSSSTTTTTSSSSSLPSNRKVMKRISYIKILKPSSTSSSVASQPSIYERVTKQILDRPFRAALFIVGLFLFK